MTNYETIKLVIDDRGVAKLALARPEKHNALSAQLIQDLTKVAKEITKNGDIRVVVLTGEGPTFCAGGDLNWMKDQFEASREERIEEARKLAMMLKALNELPKPLIAKIQGSAYGGGIGLMCICDSVVVEKNAKFGLTETRLGVIPATIGPYVIAKIGEGKARQIFMSSRIFDSDEALNLGICTKVVSESALQQAIEDEVQSYLKVSPNAVAKAKLLARSLGLKIDTNVIENTINQLADVWESEDAQAGITAFFEKRNPPWFKDI